MRKKLKIAIIAIVIIITILAFVTLKGNKKPVSSDKFIEFTTELGYSTTRSNETTSATVIEFWTAKKQDYEISFHVTMSNIDEETQKIITSKHFDEIKSEYATFKELSSIEDLNSYNNYSNYTLSTDEYYMIVTKIDNTIMFAKVPNQYKNDIINLFDKLDY